MPKPTSAREWRVILFLMLSSAPCIAAAANTMGVPRKTHSILGGAYERAWANDCETMRRPSIRRLDINRDGKVDALVHDNSECYRKFGGYFTIVTRQQGKWVRIGYGLGNPKWLRTTSKGWPDFELPDFSRNGRCSQVWRFSGSEYYHFILERNGAPPLPQPIRHRRARPAREDGPACGAGSLAAARARLKCAGRGAKQARLTVLPPV